jgi:signal transduction histidine kinase
MLQQNKTLPQPVKTALDIIHRNVQLEAKLVNDLLDVSRATIGKLRVELSDCDIHEIVERAVRVCLAPGDGNQSNIATKLNAPQRNCPGDATRLQQVFWNLIQNAMKCTSRAGSITISSRNENGDVCIDVSDTGCGIEPTKLEGIFEPFTGEKHGISGHGGQSGFGLGLFIARQIVIAHGGTLVAKSQGLNRGATFTVSLPACREEQHSPE